jgi:hypothetical protein
MSKQLKEIQVAVYRMINDGKYPEDITGCLEMKFGMSRDQAYAIYMQVQSMMPPETSIDEF